MALDGILLCKILPQIEEHLPARIQKIYQISPSEILFQIHGRKGKAQLMVSAHSQYNRMLITTRSYPTPDEPCNFVMVLRKYLEGSSILSVKQADLDRWCTFLIQRHNNIGDKEQLSMVVELMGKYANLILVNSSGIILDALKRIPPFENARRIIQPGALFHATPSQGKQDPFKVLLPEEGKTLTQQFSGFSPFLAKEVEYRMNHGESFRQVMQTIQESSSLYIANENNTAVFHCLPLTHLTNCVEYPLFEGLDVLYFHKEEKDRIRELCGDVYKLVRRELKHQQQKYPRLVKEYDDALDCDRWNKYGELLYAYDVQETKGATSITLKDYETDQPVLIPLDPRIDGKGNARRSYAKYKKLKTGQKYLEEQIRLCKTEMDYFEGLLEQLDYADFSTAEEIKQELIKGGYLNEKKKNKSRKKKTTGPLPCTLTLPNGISVSYGRNNLQNDALTWHGCKKSDIWLHAKDYHGAHVVLHTQEVDETTLRLAAQIAAWFSAGRHSSSVPVNYCHVRDLKKIPGAKPGMVQLSSYKTIYIDPLEEDLIAAGLSTQ